MKDYRQEEKWTLPINGREMTFTKQELIAILEKNFSQEANKQTNTEKKWSISSEGKRFKVDLLSIDRSIFKKKRPNRPQEMTRQFILEAFEQVDKYPERYASQFEILIPKKNWTGSKAVVEIEQYAKEFGGQVTDVVEQALEWAQRISNGESWDVICNTNDFKLIACRKGYARISEGSNEILNFIPILKTKTEVYGGREVFYNTVPVVTIKQK